MIQNVWVLAGERGHAPRWSREISRLLRDKHRFTITKGSTFAEALVVICPARGELEVLARGFPGKTIAVTSIPVGRQTRRTIEKYRDAGAKRVVNVPDYRGELEKVADKIAEILKGL